MISRSPISNNEYSLPSERLDGDLANFVELNKHRKIVAIQGLGFVGTAMSLVVAKASSHYAVVGVDRCDELNYWKIGSINNFELPIVSSDPKLSEYMSLAKENQNLFATHDPGVYSAAEIIVVDINLDVQKINHKEDELSYQVSLDNFKDAIRTIGINMKDTALILVESTVPPGTTENIIKPILSKCLEDRGMDSSKLRLAHSYERVMPGKNYIDSIENFYRVYSGINDESANLARDFLKNIIKTDQYPLTRLSNTNSTEIAKVLENSYRAMNIAFIQEWTELAEAANVNLYEVIDAIRLRPTHSNIMRPGLGVGGYCLTKDPLLASWSSKKIFEGKPLKQSEESVVINDRMPLHTYNKISNFYNGSLKGKTVLILGVSYLSDVGDTRFTPTELLYEKLKDAGAKISLVDPYVSYWQEQDKVVENSIDINNEYENIIIATNHSEFASEKTLDKINSIKPNLIIDTMGIYLNCIEKINKEINVITIGKG
tara:strand:- start:2141 stop:3604 length:1464 start_codon:yes stop_codon:yes gene_type:complete